MLVGFRFSCLISLESTGLNVTIDQVHVHQVQCINLTFRHLFILFIMHINKIMCWMTVCSPEIRKSDWIIALSILCFACEGMKLGFFFDIEPCTSDDVWRLTADNITTHHSAEQCFFQRGSYLSLSAIVCFLIPLILLFSHVACPAHAHENVAEMDYDDITLPSFLQSIGESTKTSRSSSTSGKSQESNIRRNRLSQQMAAIVEDLRY